MNTFFFEVAQSLIDTRLDHRNEPWELIWSRYSSTHKNEYKREKQDLPLVFNTVTKNDEEKV